MKLNSTIFKGIVLGGVVLGTSTIGIEAKAAEQITLSYQGSEVSLSRGELESFTETGVLPSALQNLLGTDAEVPNVIRTLLNREIRVPAFVEKFLNSSTGEFVLNQLDDTISSTSGQTEQDLFDLKSAFNNAASDQNISFMELVQKYPQSNVKVDLTNLEGTYNKVSNFVERVQPALEVAKGFLSDIICDCNQNVGSNNSNTYATDGSIYTSETKPCETETNATVATEPSDLNAIEISTERNTEEMFKVSQSEQ